MIISFIEYKNKIYEEHTRKYQIKCDGVVYSEFSDLSDADEFFLGDVMPHIYKDKSLCLKRFIIVKDNTEIGYFKRDRYGKWEFLDKSRERMAPNGKKSLLSDELYDYVRSENFKNWFGDWEYKPLTSSQVLDENGEPLVVYHGTNREFSTFEKGKVRDGGDYQENWIFFTTNKKLASKYTQGSDIIIPVFLNIREMPVIDGGGNIYRDVRMDFGYKEANVFDIKHAMYYGNDAARIKPVQGFCITDVIDLEHYDQECIGDTYYVRDPAQIKSTDNRSIGSGANIYK